MSHTVHAAPASEPRVTADTRLTWKEISALLPAQMYAAGTELVQQGAMVQDVYFLENGLVKLVHVDGDGREAIVGLKCSGWYVGSSPALASEPSPVTAVTLTRCQLQRMPAGVFQHLAHTDPAFSGQLHHMHAREVCELTMHLARLGTLSSRHRLEHFLRQLIAALHVNRSQDEVRLHLPLKHWEIARLIAVTPEHLSRLLKQMQEDGVIRREKGWVIVRDLEKLGA